MIEGYIKNPFEPIFDTRCELAVEDQECKREFIKGVANSETPFGEFMSENLKKAIRKAMELNSRKTQLNPNRRLQNEQ